MSGSPIGAPRTIDAYDPVAGAKALSSLVVWYKSSQQLNNNPMNADLTFNTIAFKKSYDLKDESLRQSTTRGVNTPDKLVIKSQAYVDSTTKVAGTRYTGRVDRVDIDANQQSITTSAYFVIAVPSSATQAQLDNVVATFKAVVADATFVVSVLNNEK